MSFNESPPSERAPAAVAADHADVAEAVTNRMVTHRTDLERVVAVPSISAPGFEPAEVRRSAELVAALFADRGFDEVELLEAGSPEAPAAVYAAAHAPDADAPTVLLYAHHDVQPPGRVEAWTSPPFAPTERHGRLFGRGTADDKGGVLAHVAAVDAWRAARGTVPCHVKVIVEGEEEIGSPHLHDFLAAHAARLRADAVVIADAANWKVGVPTLTYLLRGLVDAEVEVAAAHHALHSGLYGGPVPDPVAGLAKLLATLTDEHGAVAIPGFAEDTREPSAAERARVAGLGFDEEAFRAEAGVRDGVPLAGDPQRTPLERLWMQPAVAVLGVDAPSVAGSSNTLQPTARARVSVRLAPGQDPVRARDLLCRHLAEAAPWGLATTVTPGAAADSFTADPDHPAFEAAARALEAAFDHPVALAGLGGSIPFVEPLVRALGGEVPVLLTGVADPDTRAHGIDESLHLADWHRACVGEAMLLGELAGVLGTSGQARP